MAEEQVTVVLTSEELRLLVLALDSAVADAWEYGNPDDRRALQVLKARLQGATPR